MIFLSSVSVFYNSKICYYFYCRYYRGIAEKCTDKEKGFTLSQFNSNSTLDKILRTYPSQNLKIGHSKRDE